MKIGNHGKLAVRLHVDGHPKSYVIPAANNVEVDDNFWLAWCRANADSSLLANGILVPVS